MNKCILLLIFPFFITAQNRCYISYDMADGLPQNATVSITQDSRGYLWVGTKSAGLSKFDGQEFSNYDIANGLKSHRVSSTYTDPFGKVWISSVGFISSFYRNRFEHFSIPDMIVFDLESIGKDSLLLCTDQGLYKFSALDSNQLSVSRKPSQSKNILRETSLQKIGFKYDSDLQIIEIVKHQDVLLLATNKGLFHFDGDTLHRLAVNDRLRKNNISAIAIDRKNEIWVGVKNYGLVQISASYDLLNVYPYPSLGKSSDIIAADKIYIATENNGLAKFHVEKLIWEYLNDPNEISALNIVSLYQDKWGDIWYATNDAGIGQIKDLPYRLYGRNNGLPSDEISFTDRNLNTVDNQYYYRINFSANN